MFTISVDASRESDFKKIYDAHCNLLLKVANRIVNDTDVAEDLVHDSLIKMHEKKMVFASMDDVKYWLLRVVKNASLNYVKRKGREKNAYEKVLQFGTTTTESADVPLMKEQTQLAVKDALEKLPEKLKIVLILREYAELNYKEIGRILQISEGNVKVRVHRAREQLVKLLGDENV